MNISPRAKFILFGSLFLVAFSCARHSSAQTPNTAVANPPARLFGSAALLTNYIDKGLTQTEKNPAFQATLGYQIGQFRFGFWGSSVQYPGQQEYLNLRPFLSYQFLMATDVSLLVQYDFSRYYKSSARNGSVILIDFDLYKYHILLEQEDNWEGSATTRSWYGLRHEWSAPWQMTLEGTLGYSMFNLEGAENYADARVDLKYRFRELTYALGTTYAFTSQHSDRAGLGFLFLIKAEF